MSNGFIVYREVEDNGPNGCRSAYVKVEKPLPGEKIYHGKFRPLSVPTGQQDKDSRIEYVPVGDVTSEVYAGDAEVF